MVETARVRALRELAALKQQQLQHARQANHALRHAADVQQQAADTATKDSLQVGVFETLGGSARMNVYFFAIL